MSPAHPPRAPRILVTVLVAAGILPGCDGNVPDQPPISPIQALSSEDREILDAAKNKAAELKELRANPSRFVEMGVWRSRDTGIINDYSQVTQAELTNTSRFDVRDISGELVYRDRDGEPMATVPISFEGELRAGETRLMKARARNISGKAAIATLMVRNVTVRE